MADSKEFYFSVTDVLDDLKIAKNYNNFIADLVIKHCPNKNGLTLDFGAGNGFITNLVVPYIPKTYALELDPNLRKELKSNGLKTYKSLSEFSNNSLDYIYSLNVLEHIHDDKKCIQEFFSKLKPGGKLFLYLPAFNILYSSLDKKAKHFRRYSKNTLEQKILSESFIIKECYYVDSVGFFAAIMYKCFGSQDGDLNPRSIIFFDRFIFPVSKILDTFLGRFFGKNIVLIAKKI